MTVDDWVKHIKTLPAKEARKLHRRAVLATKFAHQLRHKGLAGTKRKDCPDCCLAKAFEIVMTAEREQLQAAFDKEAAEKKEKNA